MSTTPDSAASTAPRRMPLAARLALGQMLLLVAAFVSVFAVVLAESFGPGRRTASTEAAANVDGGFAEAEAAPADGVSAALASADPVVRGEAVFGQSCAVCHQANGEGLPGVFPPLARSDYLLADPGRAVGVVLHGLVGPVTVNGVAYESAMPPMPLADADVAAVLTYVLQAWGNRGPAVTAETVARIRAAGPKS